MYSDNRNGVVKTQHITFQRERIWDLWDELQPLFVKHYDEVATFHDIPLEPDQARYFAAEDHGQLRCYTVRVDGQLAGYAVFVVGPHLHYATSKQAVQDLVFVLPEHRRGRLGLTTLKFTDSALATEGVDVIHHHVKVKHPALRRLLEYLGYELTEWVMVKRIKRAA